MNASALPKGQREFGFASLGSGSQGNATLIAKGGSGVIIDCGFGPKELARRLLRLGFAPEQLAGIVVTHEHSDHIAGVGAVARRFGVPVWMSHGTWFAAADSIGKVPDLRFIEAENPFAIDALEFRPITVPHDAREPRQFRVSDGRASIGIVTDLGSSTPHLLKALAGCEALLLEFNHDSALLQASAYPEFLKARIQGPWGHLSNSEAALILAQLAGPGLRHFVAAHLSEKNNSPHKAGAAAAEALGCRVDDVLIACQFEGSPWLSV